MGLNVGDFVDGFIVGVFVDGFIVGTLVVGFCVGKRVGLGVGNVSRNGIVPSNIFCASPAKRR